MNKGFEVIEACWLFGLKPEEVDVVVHPQSVVHAFVELVDGSVLAQLGFPNMELPILYALTHPQRVADTGPRRFDALAAGALTFEPVVAERFPAYALGRAAGIAGGTSPATFNAANETAVELFLAGTIRFGRIAEIIDQVLAGAERDAATSLDAVLEADRAARRRALEVAC
jgi:1-deoxy-D-xylulose-5-phosphate reductoisomerase